MFLLSFGIAPLHEPRQSCCVETKTPDTWGEEKPEIWITWVHMDSVLSLMHQCASDSRAIMMPYLIIESTTCILTCIVPSNLSISTHCTGAVPSFVTWPPTLEAALEAALLCPEPDGSVRVAAHNHEATLLLDARGLLATATFPLGLGPQGERQRGGREGEGGAPSVSGVQPWVWISQQFPARHVPACWGHALGLAHAAQALRAANPASAYSGAQQPLTDHVSLPSNPGTAYTGTGGPMTDYLTPPPNPASAYSGGGDPLREHAIPPPNLVQPEMTTLPCSWPRGGDARAAPSGHYPVDGNRRDWCVVTRPPSAAGALSGYPGGGKESGRSVVTRLPSTAGPPSGYPVHGKHKGGCMGINPPAMAGAPSGYPVDGKQNGGSVVTRLPSAAGPPSGYPVDGQQNGGGMGINPPSAAGAPSGYPVDAQQRGGCVVTRLPRITRGGTSVDVKAAESVAQGSWWRECATQGWSSDERLMVDWTPNACMYYLPEDEVQSAYSPV
jgi:hypothetical protein